MAEHEGAAESANDPELPPIPAAEPSAAAMALALGQAGKDKSFTAEAAAFLRDQRRMLALQMEHLHEQRALQVEHLKQQEKHLRLRYFGDRMRIGLQLLGILAGLAVAAFLGALAWNAHEDHGVSIEAFSVPPDLAQRGLTGKVVASQLLDRLAALQAQTVTSRPASTYANDWGGDIKVEIPETGVSIGELNRYLHDWLGSETRIAGEVVRTPQGLAVTARAGISPGRRFYGAEADVDQLIGRAAEAIYADTQPYRYAVFLSTRGRTNDAIAAFSRLAQSGPPEDRAWAYTGWASIMYAQYRFEDAARLAGEAIRLNPLLQPAYPIRGLSLDALGHAEEDLAHARRELVLLKSGRAIGLPGGALAMANRIRFMEGTIAGMTGDYLRAANLVISQDTIAFEGTAEGYRPDQYRASVLASAHDLSGYRRLSSRPSVNIRVSELIALEDWNGLAKLADDQLAKGAFPPVGTVSANIAQAYANAGRLAEARSWVSKSPLDCNFCLRIRGLVAAKGGDWAAVDRWYGEAARTAPSLPLALTEWGQALLAKGDLDAAITKLSQAHRRAPAFADPLELWGEALLRKGDYDGAISKFTEANRGAPRWGRNHMRWGEALMLSGRYAEARAQYEIANGLDLSNPDRAALNILLARTASGVLHG